MAAKDPVAVLDLRSGTARSGRRGDAVGAEIPVTVHASRTTQGLGKNLPPVHEETRTVIVLQQGAVVRLTATLTTGETVVLTNRVTGADVLCRVGNVKSQPGIQHYVDLEFMQRAPGFWGDALVLQSAPLSETPASPPTPSIATAQPPAISLQATAVAPPPATMAPAPLPMPAPALATFAPAAAVVELRPPEPPLQPAPLAEDVAAPRDAPQFNPVTAIRPPAPVRLSSDSAFGSIGENSGRRTSFGSQKGLLAATAAVFLVLGGALGGYWLTKGGRTAPSSPVPQQAMSAPRMQGTTDMAHTSTATEPAPVSLNTVASQPQVDIFVDSRPPVESAVSRISPSPNTPARAIAPAVRRNNVTVGQLKAPTLKNTGVRVDSTEPPPMMIGTASNLGDPGATSALLEGTGAGPAPPPGSARPAVGGQLQPPQLISSAPPIYPSIARAQNLQGVVVLDVRVDETGKVVTTDVIAGPAPLVPAAQNAVLNWKYQPARLNGKPIAVNTRVSVRFNLH